MKLNYNFFSNYYYFLVSILQRNILMVFFFYLGIFFSKFIFVWKFEKFNKKNLNFLKIFGCLSMFYAVQFVKHFTFITLVYKPTQKFSLNFFCSLVILPTSRDGSSIFPNIIVRSSKEYNLQKKQDYYVPEVNPEAKCPSFQTMFCFRSNLGGALMTIRG